MEFDFKAAREKANLTLKQASALAGYKIPTINALELEGRGSARLKEKLFEIYGVSVEAGRHWQKVTPPMHEVVIPYRDRNSIIIAKLQKHAQILEEQLLSIREIMKEFEP